MWHWLPWRRRRRRQLRQTPLPEAWGRWIARDVPLAEGLAPHERRRLEGHLQVFLDGKTFEGCGGLTMTDEIRVTIAAQACLLLVGLEVDVPYPDLDVIRVYPSSYRAPIQELHGDVIVEGTSHRLGESSHRGYLVVSWDDVLRGARDPRDGHNVVLHEFAHQLDSESGSANGAPLLGDPGLYGPWARVLGAAYRDLVDAVDRHRPHTLDGYGATNPAEFFAVATEAFFERPRRLRSDRPALYEALRRYFGQDPAARL